MYPADLERIRLQPGDAEKLLAAKSSLDKRRPRHKRGEWFIWGPIPGDWVAAAATLPGKSLHVALAIWHAAAKAKSTTAILSRAVTKRFGVAPDSVARSLSRLEEAGLISVDRRNGRAPRATILMKTAAPPCCSRD
jgi:hypothetical protein